MYGFNEIKQRAKSLIIKISKSQRRTEKISIKIKEIKKGRSRVEIGKNLRIT